MKCNGITSPQASGNGGSSPKGGACADNPDTLFSPSNFTALISSNENSGASFTEIL